jgi:prepilin-type N-terminal cleavage/methylation domain-containing protein
VNRRSTQQIKEKISGFTIVELLIVVVVIATLAAITIVAYNGIQNRAYAAKVDSVVDAYIKIIEMYRIEHGAYPASPTTACLGEADDYPASGTYSQGVCFVDSNGVGRSVSEEFNKELRPYISRFPDGSLPSITFQYPTVTESTRGVLITSTPFMVDIMYYIKGDQSCPKGEKTLLDGSVFCGVHLER